MRKTMATTFDLQRRYTPYGSFNAEGGPWQAFAGAHRDRTSGCYLLGSGYRAYSPSLMRFCSPDCLSPFGVGGSNSYAYCAGDPVNRIDPSGAAGVPKSNSFSTPRTVYSARAIGPGDIMNYAVQSLFTANNIAGIINTVVGQMELIQSGGAVNHRAINRVAAVGDFWSYMVSLGTRASSFMEISTSTVPLEVIPYSTRFAFSSGIPGIAAYAELPGRINQLWHNSRSTGEFASLALQGTARASGLDVLASAVVQAGRSSANAVQEGGRVVSSIFLNREVVITIRGRSSASHQETRL